MPSTRSLLSFRSGLLGKETVLSGRHLLFLSVASSLGKGAGPMARFLAPGRRGLVRRSGDGVGRGGESADIPLFVSVGVLLRVFPIRVRAALVGAGAASGGGNR
ncbi:hypothetical protein GCM10009550_72040 [Actinocorallia libanotica]|uniref:Uncharacterized protein n=1 Tax=Actinocorallia libanotica TaxID=46162 RepID=A0ABN1RY98_9ACTN